MKQTRRYVFLSTCVASATGSRYGLADTANGRGSAIDSVGFRALLTCSYLSSRRRSVAWRDRKGGPLKQGVQGGAALEATLIVALHSPWIPLLDRRSEAVAACSAR